MMRLLLALLLVGCASAPPELVRVNSDVNNRASYSYYVKRDFRYLKAGDEGNCAAFTWTKFVDLVRLGFKPTIKSCTLWTGEGHAYVVVDGWALDNRWDYPVKEDEVGCKESK